MTKELIYEIKPEDVGSTFTQTLPKSIGLEVACQLGNYIGFMDIYKRIYLITLAHSDYYTIENNEQRDKRIGKVI